MRFSSVRSGFSGFSVLRSVFRRFRLQEVVLRIGVVFEHRLRLAVEPFGFRAGGQFGFFFRFAFFPFFGFLLRPDGLFAGFRLLG